MAVKILRESLAELDPEVCNECISSGHRPESVCNC